MSDGTDPMQMMRDAYAQGIERWSTAMEEIVGSEDFAAASGQMLALYAQQQQAIRAASRVAAESVQMPTTEDLAEVARLVINVERKVDEVTDQTAGLGSRLGAIETGLSGISASGGDVPGRLDTIEATLAEGPKGLEAVSARLSAIEEALAESARGAKNVSARLSAIEAALADGASGPDAPSARLARIEAAVAALAQRAEPVAPKAKGPAKDVAEKALAPAKPAATKPKTAATKTPDAKQAATKPTTAAAPKTAATKSGPARTRTPRGNG